MCTWFFYHIHPLLPFLQLLSLPLAPTHPRQDLKLPQNEINEMLKIHTVILKFL
jgi:hypothetical protein